jgi:hypothetical protein
MLTYRLTGTTEAIGIDHDEPNQSLPQPSGPAIATRAQSSPAMVRLNDGAALLICKCGSTAASVHPLATTHVLLQPQAFGPESASRPSSRSRQHVTAPIILPSELGRWSTKMLQTW